MTRVVILGGGPAGLGAAYKLATGSDAEVTLLERAPLVGGNAGSFEWNGHHLDYGSHRLHPASDERVLDDIRRLLGDDLHDRPRHGRIRLQERWVHFPLKPLDLLLHLRPGFTFGTMKDVARKALPTGPAPEEETFASILERSLGPTICRHFYFPYARKIWGLDPERLSPIQARKRVSAGSVGKLLKKVLGQVPGLRKPGAGRFFYPERGFGQISGAYADAARSAGADLRLGHTVERVEVLPGGGPAFRVHTGSDAGPAVFEAEHVWSTIPVTLLAGMLDPAPPGEIVGSAGEMEYRAMTLAYVELDADRYTEFDAHYFPSADIRMTRLSEPKNYAARAKPEGRTVLCAEIPCRVGDDIWTADDAALGRLVLDDLERSGLPSPGEPVAVTARRLSHAYPVYLTGYQEPFETLDRYMEAIPDLLSFGRQGLFAHDNTHHALFMSYCASECLSPDGTFDTALWREHRKLFESHVVED